MESNCSISYLRCSPRVLAKAAAFVKSAQAGEVGPLAIAIVTMAIVIVLIDASPGKTIPFAIVFFVQRG